MAGQRMSHPEQSTSRKVTTLSDFEYRVWEQTKLSSDDFGVMPYTATVLRADNLRLRKASEKLVFDALKALVAIGLLLIFEHQDEEYVCAPRWQSFQQIRFPRRTVRPCPPAEVIGKCDYVTRTLFGQYPGGRRKDAGQKTDTSPSCDSPILRHPDDEVPANANANANANADAQGSPEGSARLAKGTLTLSPLALERQREKFAFYGARLKVPHVLHLEFADKLGRRADQLQGWYQQINDELFASGDSFEDVFPFLRPKFTEWARELRDADEIAKWRPRGA